MKSSPNPNTLLASALVCAEQRSQGGVKFPTGGNLTQVSKPASALG